MPLLTVNGDWFMVPDNPQLDWKAWFDAHGARLLLYARQQTRSEADAEDVLQEACVRVWRSASNPTLPQFFSAVRRAAIDLGRQLERRGAREAVVAAETPSLLFDLPLEDRERAANLEKAIRTLPAPQQEVLMLKIWGGLTFEEIADTVGAPANTVASRYRYALQALRSNLHLLRS